MKLRLALLASLLASTVYAGTPTAHYSWSKPTTGADADTWGTQINTDLDGIDTVVFGKCDLVGCTMTGTQTLAPGSTTVAPLKFQAGVLLTSPVAHAQEWDGAHLWVTQSTGPTRKQLAYIDDAITGSAAKWTTPRVVSLTGDATSTCPSLDGSAAISCAVSVVKWTTPRSFTLTGDATGSAASVDGSANVSIALTGVQAAKLTTGRVISLTGDVTATCPAFDGSAAISCVTTGVQAAKLTTARSISATGDASWTVSFDGSGAATATLTLSLVGANGTFGDGYTVGQINVDRKGRVITETDVPIATMVGDSGSGGTKGFVPAPAAGDGAAKKYLRADGTWAQATYTSGNLTISNGATATLTHGLGSDPTEMQAFIVCTIANDGYTPGQTVLVGPPSSNNSTGIQIWHNSDGTTMGYALGNANLQIINPSTGATNALNNSDWVLVIKARAS